MSTTDIVTETLKLLLELKLIFGGVVWAVQVTEGQFVASSPDERAIMEASFQHGLVYNGELADGRISVTVQGKDLWHCQYLG